MQDVVVMAFRKRLKKRGYVDISIRRLPSGEYSVSGVEPLAGIPVTVKMDSISMYGSFRF